MRPFKFFQKKPERVFTEWLDQLDDYHLGGIQPISNRNVDEFVETVIGMIEHCRTHAIHMVGFSHSFEMRGFSHTIELTSVVRIAGGAQVHYNLTIGDSTISVGTIINNNRW